MRAPGDWLDVDARVDRRMRELDRTIAAKVAADAAAAKQRAADDLLRRVTRGEPAAMRTFFEDSICRPNRITFEYSARGEWFAVVRRRHVCVPPPCELTALAICLHEAGHVVEGLCPRSGAHRFTPSGCKECERRGWTRACSWVPFDFAMFTRMRKAIGTYRSLPAPASVDRAVGTLQLASDFMKRRRLEDCVERQERVMRDIERARRT